MGCRSCKGSTTKTSPSTVLTVEQALMRDKKPKVDKEGGLTFDKLAPTMHGYVHDPMNPNRLIPDKVPCVHRITLPVLGKDRVWVMNQCNCIGCPLRGQTVDNEVCSGCEFRQEKTNREKLE